MRVVHAVSWMATGDVVQSLLFGGLDDANAFLRGFGDPATLSEVSVFERGDDWRATSRRPGAFSF